MVAAPAMRARNHPPNGARADRYEEYHPYGSTAWWAGDAATVSKKRYRYTGMERDEETGLQCHGVRYYAVWLGRWVSADPIGRSGGANLYLYAAHNPIGANDRTGLKPQTPATKAGNEDDQAAPNQALPTERAEATWAAGGLSAWYGRVQEATPVPKYGELPGDIGASTNRTTNQITYNQSRPDLAYDSAVHEPAHAVFNLQSLGHTMSASGALSSFALYLGLRDASYSFRMSPTDDFHPSSSQEFWDANLADGYSVATEFVAYYTARRLTATQRITEDTVAHLSNPRLQKLFAAVPGSLDRYLAGQDDLLAKQVSAPLDVFLFEGDSELGLAWRVHFDNVPADLQRSVEEDVFGGALVGSIRESSEVQALIDQIQRGER